jgi:DUF4097 and DUF4098 domain-containing protein YvlB
MKRNQAILTCTVMVVSVFSLLVFSPAAIYGQEKMKPQVERAEVPLTDPSKPALVKASVHVGSITVTGFDGKSIMVEARLAEKTYREKTRELLKAREILELAKLRQKEKHKKMKETAGMHKIQSRVIGLTIEEENNEVEVKTSWLNQKIQLDIKVPYKTSLKIKALNDGYIKVENVEGEMDVNHLNGPLTLQNVSGTVIAHSMNGDVKVVFAKVNLKKPMSFSTFNGDIDVTFPKNAKFNVKMNTRQGEIYSDFKLDMQAPGAPPKGERKNGKYSIKFDNTINARLNGGGEEVLFKTYNGDIFIREKK